MHSASHCSSYIMYCVSYIILQRLADGRQREGNNVKRVQRVPLENLPSNFSTSSDFMVQIFSPVRRIKEQAKVCRFSFCVTVSKPATKAKNSLAVLQKCTDGGLFSTKPTWLVEIKRTSSRFSHTNLPLENNPRPSHLSARVYSFSSYSEAHKEDILTEELIKQRSMAISTDHIPTSTTRCTRARKMVSFPRG